MNELLLMCRIAERQVAFPATDVRSVIEIEDITAIPGTPAFIAGLTALRSQALTVVDSRAALGLAPFVSVVGRRAAVVEIDGHPYALVLDEAHDVSEATSLPEPVPGGFGAGWEQAASGKVETVDGPALLLDPQCLIAGPQMADC